VQGGREISPEKEEGSYLSEGKRRRHAALVCRRGEELSAKTATGGDPPPFFRGETILSSVKCHGEGASRCRISPGRERKEGPHLSVLRRAGKKRLQVGIDPFCARRKGDARPSKKRKKMNRYMRGLWLISSTKKELAGEKARTNPLQKEGNAFFCTAQEKGKNRKDSTTSKKRERRALALLVSVRERSTPNMGPPAVALS